MKPYSKLNFLIVDDIDTVRRSIRAMLRLMHYGDQLYEAANGLEALKYLHDDEISIDFVIADYKMPYMTGTELLSSIRSNKKLRDMPFLMITADANMDVVAEAAEHEVDGYITKPFVTASLEQKIVELINQADCPGLLTLHLRKIRHLEEQGDIEGAIAEAKMALAASPESSRPYRELGRLHLKQGDLQNSLSCFQKATDSNRLDVVSYHHMGQIYHRLGMIDRAIENFGRAMDISPRHSMRAVNFANLLLKQKKLPEAERVLKMVLRNNPEGQGFREDIADTCSIYGLHDLAIKTYRSLLDQAAERHPLLKKLGIALQRKGNNVEAVKVLEEIIGRYMEDVETLLVLAKAYLGMGMWVRAEKWAVLAIRLEPGNEEAKEILDKCL